MPTKLQLLMMCIGVSALVFRSSSEASPCFIQASQAMDVPVPVLELVAALEGGQAGTVSQNRNGSEDLGRMQINTWWLPRLAKLGITRDDLLRDDCLNIHVSAWILAQERTRAENWAGAIAGYHSPNKHHQARYLRRALRLLQRLKKDEETSSPR